MDFPFSHISLLYPHGMLHHLGSAPPDPPLHDLPPGLTLVSDYWCLQERLPFFVLCPRCAVNSHNARLVAEVREYSGRLRRQVGYHRSIPPSMNHSPFTLFLQNQQLLPQGAKSTQNVGSPGLTL